MSVKVGQLIGKSRFIGEFKKFVVANGGPAKTARLLGVAPQNITNIKAGDKSPSPKILKLMGFRLEREIKHSYRKIGAA